MKKIIDEFTELNVSRGTKRYLRSRRDGICVRCMKRKSEQDRVWCENCRGLREKRNTGSKKTVNELHNKWKDTKPKLKLKFLKPRVKNQHHQYLYKGSYYSLKEICKLNGLNYPMAKYWKQKNLSIKAIIKKNKIN